MMMMMMGLEKGDGNKPEDGGCRYNQIYTFGVNSYYFTNMFR